MWKTISSKEIFNHPRLNVIEDDVELPDETKIKYLKFKDDDTGCITIIAKQNNKILIQKEYSYPPNKLLFQFPGGTTHAGEDLKDGANRELMEESGFYANNLTLLGSYYLNNRRSAKMMNVYLATDLENKSLKADKEEEIENFWFTEEEIERMIINNEIVNCHVLAAWSLYKLKK